jgi:hypothetical protein
MATTYSTSLKLALIGDGDQSGIWGQTTNTNLGTLLEQAITGVVSITMVDANYTLSNLNGVSDEARNAVLVVDGTNNAVRDVIAPLVEKLYVIRNSTTGGYAINIRAASGSSVSVPNGTASLVYCDGTNFVLVSNSNNINGNLTVTGTTALSGALNGTTGVFSGAISAVSPTFTGTPLAPTASVSTDNTQIATTAFVRDIIPTGIISMWSGSIGSIPSGWLICDGTNGTPDLRNRFVVGAGSTYAVNATGGTADAIVVSHTHTFTTGSAGTHNHALLSGVAGFSVRGFGEVNGNGVIGYDRTDAYYTNGQSGVQLVQDAGSHNHTGTTDTSGSSGTNQNLPPYYALAYIMKA